MEWFIKVNFNLAFLYLCYQWLFQFSGNRKLARVLLLTIPVISMVLPLLSFSIGHETTTGVLYIPDIMVRSAASISEQSPGFFDWFRNIYYAGVALSVLVSVMSVVFYMKTNKNTAYSILAFIHIPEGEEQQRKMMLLHEQAHVRYYHSVDVFFYLLVKAVFWVNPVVYLLFQSLKQEHEFAADRHALKHTDDTEAYCNLLIDDTFGVITTQAPVHSFHSRKLLLNRIKMITQTQPQSVPGWKKIATLTSLALLFFVSFGNLQLKAQGIDGKIYAGKDMPDVMPEFPGGGENLMKFLGHEIKYPAKCRDQKIEGRVVLKFIVDKNGRIKNVENVREGVDPLLIAEAKRVVSGMPKWAPGMKNGEAVNTEFILPVNFKL